MRAALVVVALLPACFLTLPRARFEGRACDSDAECDGLSCPAGICIRDDSDSGEGERDGEGEGGIGEGEGDIGEGEGDIGEGEGDIGEGEGEGEGDAGEGEGEGEPNCASCNAFQSCVNGACEYVGTICDAFGVPAIPSIPSSTAGVLTTSDSTYDRASSQQAVGDHAFDAFRVDFGAISEVLNLIRADTTTPPEVAVRVSLSATGFDPFLAVYDETLGCSLQSANDDFPTNDTRHSRIDLTRDLLVDGATILATSFAANDPGGAYTLELEPRLCGQPVDSTATFNGCGRALSQTTNTCPSNNPCEVDPAGVKTGFACCISTSAATTSTANSCGRRDQEPIFRFAVAACAP